MSIDKLKKFSGKRAAVAMASGLVCGMLVWGAACKSGADQRGGPDGAGETRPTGPVPKGPPGVDYRASCEFQQTGVCVDVFTDGGIDAKSALPQGCTPLNASCIRQNLKGLCKLETKRGGGRIYSEHLFYTSMAGRAVTEKCINNSGRLVRYDY